MTLMFEGSTSYGAWSADTAMSGEAMYLRNAAYDEVSRAEQSQALFGERAEAIQRIWKLHAECSVDDWDGYGGMPISRETAHRAADVIRVLPHRIPMPEFSAEPDGSIALDWISSRNKLFSMSIGRTDRVSYAWLDGADRGHGVAVFDDGTVPPRVLEGIQGAIGRERTRVRVT